MEQVLGSLYTFGLFVSFVLGAVVAFIANGYIDAYIDNAAYAKSITHPEMLDENGNLIHDELIYIRKDILELEDDDED